MSDAPIVMVHNDTPGPVIDVITARHPDLIVAECDSYAGLPQALESSGASVVYTLRFAGTPGFPRASLVENDAVRWVSVAGSGTDHLMPWNPATVTVTNAAGVAADMMAEYALGAALHFSLGFDGFRAAQAERRWGPGRVAPIEGKTALILGLGETGRAAARRFKAMGLTVLGVRARPHPTDNVDEVHGMDRLTELLPRADVILVCVPLLPSTKAMLGAEALAHVKPGAVLVDVSRGGVVDEAALIGALTDGRLAGAALDVFETEPLPPDNPLWALPNAIVTPHCASVYDGWELRSADRFAQNLARYRRGEALQNVVDPTRGY